MKKTGSIKIAIGPVFEEFGGVSQHILSIQKFSSNHVNVVPPGYIRALVEKLAGRRTYLANMYLYKYFISRIGLRGYDILHSHVDPYFRQICLQSKTATTKWVHTFHYPYLEDDYAGGLTSEQKESERKEIEITSKADARISVCQWLHDYLYNIYSIQTEVITNGVDMESCKKANQDKFFKKYHFDEFVLFVGSIDFRKNPQLFVRLAACIPNIKFVMIGRKLNPVSIMKEYGLSIPKNLSILGEMRHENVLDALAACKAFIITSRGESGPIILLEAMALGKPCVVPNHSGCKEIVVNDENGFLYQLNSLDELVEKTKQALVSANVGRRGQERVMKEYDWKILAKKIDSLYENILGQARGD